ncbi:MAG: hypothetical protein U0X20_25220 [Caldilineaceae bacterium]
MPRNQLFAKLGELSALTFGTAPDNAFKVSQQQLGQAAKYEDRYVYDSAQDAMIDQETHQIYKSIDGVFTSEDGQKLSQGSPRR